MTSPEPRTTTSGTRSGRPTNASAPAWPGVGTSWTASAGIPLASSAGAMTSSTRAFALPNAAAPVRRTAALRALSTCDATSTVTLGLASNTAPMTPTGTRRSYTRSPVGSSRTNVCSGGSGVAARTSSWVAMSARRSGVRRRRSSRPCAMPPARAASTSARLAASRSSARSRRSPAAARRAASTAGPPAARTPGAAAAARLAASRTAVCSGDATTAVLTPQACHAATPGAQVPPLGAGTRVGERRTRALRSGPALRPRGRPAPAPRSGPAGAPLRPRAAGTTPPACGHRGRTHPRAPRPHTVLSPGARRAAAARRPHPPRRPRLRLADPRDPAKRWPGLRSPRLRGLRGRAKAGTWAPPASQGPPTAPAAPAAPAGPTHLASQTPPTLRRPPGPCEAAARSAKANARVGRMGLT